MASEKKLRILFDASPLLGDKSGVGYYTDGLIRALASLEDENIELVGHYFNFLGRHDTSQLPTAPNLSYRSSKLLPGKVVNLLRRAGIEIPFEFLIKTKGDFILFPAFLSRPSLFHTPYAPVIHDLTYLIHPEYVAARNQQDLERFVPGTLEHASFVMTVAESIKESIVEAYPSTSQPILVEHIPATSSHKVDKKQQGKILSKFGIKKPYIVFLGTLEPRKNITGLLDAYAHLPETIQEKYSLVLAGGKGWNDDDIQSQLAEMKESKLSVIETGYIDEAQKYTLLNNANVLVYPSFYEGYGMQLLEACAFHLPVVASDIPVFHEVIGEGALYFDPHSPKDISDKISAILTNTQLKEQTVAHQTSVVSQKSWETMARVVIEQIKQSLDKS